MTMRSLHSNPRRAQLGKPLQRIAGLGLLSLAMSLIGLVGVGVPASAVAAPQSHRIPVQVDGQTVLSNLWLRFDLTRINVPLASFSPRTPTEVAFATLMRALQAGDVQAAAPLILRRNLGDAPLPEVLSTWRRVFNDFKEIQVVARARIGEREVIFWLAQGTKGPWLRGFSFDRADGTLRAELTSSTVPVERLVLDVVEHETLHPTEYAPRDAWQGDYALRIADGVSLDLPGAALSGDVMNQSPPDQHPALRRYAALLQALKAGRLGEWLAGMGPVSRKHITDWRGAKADHFEGWRNWQSAGRELLFLADGGPVVLVFYAEGGTEGMTDAGRSVRWDTLYQVGGQWQQGNFHRFEYFDDALARGALPHDERAFVRLLNRSRRK
jgi:hypothetical protein